MDQRTHQDPTRAALIQAGLPVEELWVSYFGLGGDLSQLEVDAYLNALFDVSVFDRDILATAANELLEEAYSALRVPCSAEAQAQSHDGNARRMLGAAGSFLLSPAEAEEERLGAVTRTHLLDTPGEERFDRITRQAREQFGVSTATVALIDDHRQFLKSMVGNVSQDMPREISFCNATIRNAGPLIVTDARTDPRFKSNPLVLGEPYIRFYAGYPLRGLRGWTVGTLCVIDQNPRDFSAEDEQSLRDLATIAEQEINTTPDDPKGV
ncbi:GAF domain-containing protein [Arthrobacter sp. Soc17.1.1.1]|uniref:GAF domain-containing protein n=1 Tax=Arthrobacter sp. Soc17.1.1.1 TaxID=3121277 RepID=UPI002FE4F6B4